MSITKLKMAGRWGSLTNDLTQVGTRLGGRRVITGMLTGSGPGPMPVPEEPIEPPPPAVARIAGTRPGTSRR
jgi:hypothetical protein